MIALILTVLMAAQGASVRVDAAAPAGSAAADAIRVATFNIRYDTPADGPNRWALRKELVFATVRKMDPDAVGFQEVVAHQFDALAEAMPAYAFVGVGRDDGRRNGEFVPVAYKRDRFEKLAEGHFWLSETPERPGSKSWDAAITRVTTWVRLKDRNDGRTLLFMNTHFDHKGNIARAESAKLLRTRIEALREGNPVILVGDFNTGEDTEPYATLRGKPGVASSLVDGFRATHAIRGAEEGTFNGFKGERTGARIDWILHTPDITTVSCDIVRHSEGERYPSDHFPVEAVLRRAPPER